MRRKPRGCKKTWRFGLEGNELHYANHGYLTLRNTPGQFCVDFTE